MSTPPNLLLSMALTCNLFFSMESDLDRTSSGNRRKRDKPSGALACRISPQKNAINQRVGAFRFFCSFHPHDWN